MNVRSGNLAYCFMIHVLMVLNLQYLLVMKPLVRFIKSDVSRESKPAWEMRDSGSASRRS